MSENNEPTRRGFLKSTAAVGAAGLAATQGFASSAPATSDAAADYLRQYAVPRETIDRFLDPTARVWAKYDPTYGYLLRDAFLRDGVDGARTLGRYTQDGPRRQVNFTDEPCRINTYGDSFTQGHQVSDGETWQEVLAAHFCEPIRNYGIGGFGVYQAYRRMLENEATENGADHLVLNIWGDDHHRSVYSCRWLSFPTSILSGMTGAMYHANPWVHARLDPNTDELLEKPNACPNEESLYGLCEQNGLSSAHATFIEREQVPLFEQADWLIRSDIQFHWLNRDYSTFDDFLAELASRKRKNLRKERAAAQESVRIVHLSGDDIKPEHWDAFWMFYQDTGARKWGTPYLTREAFTLFGERMGDRLVLILAYQDDQPIAGALNFIGSEALYGRYWGCTRDVRFLHFELCYYQAIDLAIELGLPRVEAGAQGGHKLARGYEPVQTYSAHWLADPGFRDAVADFLEREREGVATDQLFLGDRTPFKKVN